jgi:uncharacterized protein (DUF58 family)
LPNKPTIAEASALGGGLPALMIESARVADTLSQGTHGRRRVGLGESFWQFRKYEPGDAATRIDWRQSAKGDRLFVRETEWEAAHSLWLWRDTSASMDYASASALPTKRARADILLLALANLALRGGERVGLLGQAPVTTQAGFQRFAASLALADNGPADLPPPARMQRHSTVILFGDFLGPLPEIAEAIGALSAQGVAGIIVQILDPAELSLPFSGRVRFEGVEGEASEIVPRAERIADQYRERLAAQQQGLERVATKAGWRIVLDRTDVPALQGLLPLYQMLAGDL